MAGTYTVTVTPAARDDFQELLEYAQEYRSLRGVDQLQGAILAAIARLEEMPAAHPPVLETYSVVGTKFRRIVVDNYKVIYEIDEQSSDIYVIRILHVKRGTDFVQEALL